MEVYLFTILALAAGYFWGSRSRKCDEEVTASEILEGVQRGWYTATLLQSGTQKMVEVVGIDKDGQKVTEVRNISDATYAELKEAGIPQR